MRADVTQAVELRVGTGGRVSVDIESHSQVTTRWETIAVSQLARLNHENDLIDDLAKHRHARRVVQTDAFHDLILGVRPIWAVSKTAPMPAWMSWSSGKDSTLALAVAREDLGVDVVALLTTVNESADRVAMHAVRRQLLQAQADRLGLTLVAVDIPSPPNEVYEARMRDAIAKAQADGIDQMVFGDLYLEDIRSYRETNLAGTGIAPVFPLWERPTDALAGEMLDRGVRAIVTCVDPRVMPASFAGRAYDESFLADLPESVDPCGENGEFHSFVWDGPGFSSPIDVVTGEVVERDGFVFADVLPA